MSNCKAFTKALVKTAVYFKRWWKLYRWGMLPWRRYIWIYFKEAHLFEKMIIKLRKEKQDNGGRLI